MNQVLIILLLATALLFGVAVLQGRHMEGLRASASLFLHMFPLLVVGFLVAGLLQAVLPEPAVAEWLGSASGWRGILVGYLAGAATLGGPWLVFPIGAALLKGGASVTTVATFATSWAIYGGTAPIYELAILGPRFMAAHLLASLLAPLAVGLLASALYHRL
ncbi:MAG: permease [Deltaproteobacteria bacterium]|nr:permease [Deltaproteobacteria bacterium]